MWYLPPHVTQRTGSKCQFSNCWCALGSWLHRAATGGLASVTPEEFRIVAGGGSGRKNPLTGCISGTEQDIVKGLTKLGVKAEIVKLPPQAALARMSTERRAVWGIATDYDAWPEAKDCMNGVAGPDVNHAVGFIGGTPTNVMNPLCGDYQQLKPARVLAAAQKYATNNGRSTIWMIRVARPLPVGLPADQARIDELETQLQEAEDLITTAATQAEQLFKNLSGYQPAGK